MIFCRLGSEDCGGSSFFLFCGSVGEGGPEGKPAGEDMKGIFTVGGEEGSSGNKRAGEEGMMC
jgi:hypothetical protein